MNARSPHVLNFKLTNLLQKPIKNIESFNQIYSFLLTSGSTHNHSTALKLSELLVNYNSPLFTYQTLKSFYHQYQNPFFFNTSISNFAKTKYPHFGFLVYKHMVGDGIHPDKYTFPIVLKSCAKSFAFLESKQLHGSGIKMGFSCDLYVQNALINVYCICGEYDSARNMFDFMHTRDVVSWTGLISGYVKGEEYKTALHLFSIMDVKPNIATMVSMLVTSGRLGELKVGRRIHGLIIKSCNLTGSIVGNALLDMYMKCEQVGEAKKVFKKISDRDIVSWTCLVSGLVQCKRPRDAIVIFHEMQEHGVEADKVVLSSVLSACANLGALDMGRWVHEYIDRKGIERDVHIGTALVDMYAKCGVLETAISIFHNMPCKNICSWDALLGGLAMHGHGQVALNYFDRMVKMGTTTPNEVTFIAILNACSHSGLVEEGRRLFNDMIKRYNITPRIEHYGCIVDLLCRAELLEEAYDLVKSMPMKGDVRIWGSLLSACRSHKNDELVKQILDYPIELEQCDSGVYVLLSHVYAMNGRWGDVSKVRRLMKKKGVKKEPGSSAIEVDGEVHEFFVGETTENTKEFWLTFYVLTRHVELDGI